MWLFISLPIRIHSKKHELVCEVWETLGFTDYLKFGLTNTKRNVCKNNFIIIIILSVLFFTVNTSVNLKVLKLSVLINASVHKWCHHYWSGCLKLLVSVKDLRISESILGKCRCLVSFLPKYKGQLSPSPPLCCKRNLCQWGKRITAGQETCISFERWQVVFSTLLSFHTESLSLLWKCGHCCRVVGFVWVFLGQEGKAEEETSHDDSPSRPRQSGHFSS